MANGRKYLVKDLAHVTGVSVRTLHHYHDIGLLVPASRTASGYRVYTEEDLLRLQQILIERELGLPLAEIKRSLDDPHFDHRAALQRQRTEIASRAERAAEMLRSIDAALAMLTNKKGKTMKNMTDKEAKVLFDGFDPRPYEHETRERWGDTDAYRESTRRTSRYTKAQWQEYKAENEAIMGAAAELFRSSVPAESEEAMAVAERHRLSIDRWFYPCSSEMHLGLADMYEADDRFQKNIDKHASGLTSWLSSAIRANAQRYNPSCQPMGDEMG